MNCQCMATSVHAGALKLTDLGKGYDVSHGGTNATATTPPARGAELPEMGKFGCPVPESSPVDLWGTTQPENLMATTDAGTAGDVTTAGNSPSTKARQKKPVAVPQTAQVAASPRTQTSRPEYRVELPLHSIQAQRVFDRSYQTMAYSLFAIEVILRIMGEKPENVAAVLALVDTRIANVKQQILAAKADLTAKAKEAGLEKNPVYSQPVTVTAPISTPQAGRVADMMSRLDDVMATIDMLWLNGEMSGEDRTAEQHRWERRFYSLAGFLFNLQARARDEAKRRGKDQEVHEEAPEPAAEQTAHEVAAEAKIAARDAEGASVIPVASASVEKAAELATA